jgi:hypothetical protein
VRALQLTAVPTRVAHTVGREKQPEPLNQMSSVGSWVAIVASSEGGGFQNRLQRLLLTDREEAELMEWRRNLAASSTAQPFVFAERSKSNRDHMGL